MKTILAHRANLTGPKSVVENSAEACAAALDEGFGLETDIRRDVHGRYFISHDPHPRTEENALELYSAIFQKYPDCELAINVKELGYEAGLVELMNSGRLGKKCFYFDFELLEPASPGQAQRKLKSIPGSKPVRIASRLSDRKEPISQCLSIPAEIVWGDEFDSLWISREEIEKVHEAGRIIYMISPEIHGFDMTTTRKRWQDFKDWGVDGICTDFPIAAREFFAD
jgi:hypothetical protein